MRVPHLLSSCLMHTFPPVILPHLVVSVFVCGHIFVLGACRFLVRGHVGCRPLFKVLHAFHISVRCNFCVGQALVLGAFCELVRSALFRRRIILCILVRCTSCVGHIRVMGDSAFCSKPSLLSAMFVVQDAFRFSRRSSLHGPWSTYFLVLIPFKLLSCWIHSVFWCEALSTVGQYYAALFH